MLCSVRPLAAALFGGMMLMTVAPVGAWAQSAPQEQKPAEQKSPEEQAKEEALRRSVEEYAEAAKLPGNGGLPECVWSGRRIAMLLWRDDIDTARRHLELYERFGCPTEHLKIAFRCLVRQGNIDSKAQERLSERVHACWVNPDAPPAAATPAPAAAQ
ncbi:hypothetical protein EV667_2452 [Ancylobacter aquaticus]|uniref:Beta-1-3, beta-1-6-glucan biosynthesis protein n=1 Tax=Ancylobacter aquaticus TaxID=100 RepID=A0A4R1I136_ANCAQ|nr:hypothetical protein [Ancylobacter aquaticus]TCK28448.1 hypothetical protein EV667_2452 [Ancylobacter aquaticus]